jgi:putative phosphoesterase
MKIGVVADTHSREVPSEVLEAFADVDVIIHAGDFCTLEDYNVFAKLKKEFYSVIGNMDDSQLIKKLPVKKIFELGGLRFGLYHGHGPAKRVLDFVQEEFAEECLDVIIFGHSHQALKKTIGSTLYFNPGSPNDDISAPYCSYGMLEIKGQKIKAQIIKID